MAEQLVWETLDRYLAGEATPDERARVQRWIDEVPERIELLQVLRQDRASVPSAAADVDAAWRRVASRIHAHDPSRRFARWLVPTAAALLIAASLAVWRTRAGSEDGRPAVSSQLALRELTTPNGRRASLLLADGSRVVLNAGSRLRYSVDIGRTGAARDVYLDGEAYFEVTHDAKHLFRVHAGRALAHDLGTKFSVRAYAGASAQVVVAEGMVSLRANEPASLDSAVLGPGQRGRLVSDGLTMSAAVVVDSVDAERYLSWTNGTLTFVDTPLREAIPVLERWFDIEIRLADSTLAGRRVTAAYRDQPLSQVLDALAVALDARYERSSGNPRLVTLSAGRRGT